MFIDNRNENRNVEQMVIAWSWLCLVQKKTAYCRKSYGSVQTRAWNVFVTSENNKHVVNLSMDVKRSIFQERSFKGSTSKW